MFVYLVTNKINGKKYVGQHSGSNLQRYWDRHVRMALASPTDRVRAIYSAIRKYGADSFEIEPLLIVDTKEEMDFHEIDLIKRLNTKVPHGYNLTDGGDGVLNPSQESRQKMSDSHKGKKQSEETKRKRAEKLTGQKRSEETKKKMSLAQEGNQNGLGHVKSESARRKISEANMGNKNSVGAVRTPEYLIRLSKRSKGRTFSEDTKRKMSESASTRVASQETRNKLSEARIRDGVRPPVLSSEEAARAGQISGHKRYHVARNIINPNCLLCQGVQCQSTIESQLDQNSAVT
jgi:group I intron endonuclease